MIPINTTHLVCGDYAGKKVRVILGKWAHIVVLRDDLAVGPLEDVDDVPALEREQFWLDVVPTEQPVYVRLAEEVAVYQTLDQCALCIVWIGNDCAEQIMLRRIAWYCRNAETKLAVVEVESSRGKSSVALTVPEQLVEHAVIPRMIGTLEQTYLADEWEKIRTDGGGVRFWRHRKVENHPIDVLDPHVVAAIGNDWQLALPLIPRLMEQIEGLFVTDAFLIWRMRQLALAGKVEWREEGADIYVRNVPAQ